jgi:ferredoxin
MSGPRLTVDDGRCCGYGNCAELLPQVFRLRDSDGLAEVASEPKENFPELQAVIRDCPAEAIFWHDEP